MKKPTDKERKLRAYRVNAIRPYITELEHYSFDAISEFAGNVPREQFYDYILICSGNTFMSIFENCMMALEDYKALEFV